MKLESNALKVILIRGEHRFNHVIESNNELQTPNFLIDKHAKVRFVTIVAPIIEKKSST